MNPLKNCVIGILKKILIEKNLKLSRMSRANVLYCKIGFV